ncbi:sigma-70 family RNA polymerase sigma factor [Niameybacter massiliensis]|uniref:Sigma-70 family RNA polymerase sigma factor n=1 Tax=Holtiella tumoricola TaxID=3018743 RepID=A0AA42J2R4_9FIRM|nr:sigma-70 family RNA polymerase sigma factor [Holtiella tumoricola]MDA3733580.1 sigma-70 family RNA polymerase sigma factor [Holtiella tumoricola]
MYEVIEELVRKSKSHSLYSYELWQHFEPLCTKWAHKLKEVDYSVEDLMQESYLILCTAIDTYNQDKEISFSAYYKVMLYRWGSNYRRKNREVLVVEEREENFWDRIQDEQVQVEQQILQKEVVKSIEWALHRLSEKERKLMIKLYFSEKSLNDLATAEGLSYKALTSKKYYLLKKLKKIFEENPDLLCI